MHELPRKSSLRTPPRAPLNQVVLDLQVLEQELDRLFIVRLDPADFGRRDDDDRRPFPVEESLHCPASVRSSSVRVRVTRWVNPPALNLRKMALPTRPRWPAMKIDSSFSIMYWAASV